MSNKYYVYQINRPWNNLPAYVGKGCGRRYNWHKSAAFRKEHNNKHLQNVFLKANRLGLEIEPIFVAENLYNEDSKKLEIKLIKEIGRKDLGLGPLCNKTDGGEGTLNISPKTRELLSKQRKGSKRPQKTKDAISQSLKDKKHSPERILANSLSHRGEKHYMYGKHHTEETKQILSEQRSGSNHYFFGKTWSEERRKRTMEGRQRGKEEKEKLQKTPILPPQS